MLPQDEYIRNLLHGYIQNSLNTEETEELFGFIENYPKQMEPLLKEVTGMYEDRMINPRPLNEEISRRMRDALLTKINAEPDFSIGRTRTMYARRWVAAAAILLMVGAGIYFMPWRKGPAIAARPVINPAASEKDILPGFDGAVLTTAGGTTIVLDTAMNGIVSKEGNTDVVKHSNQLIYNVASNTPAEAESFNTLSTLKGRKFQLLLADGTKVWLDAASSITYPIAFTGSQRKVKVTGQVYFEVAKDPSKPFIVEARGTQVQVLGTHFNVNAYEDETALRTTLLEGVIKITNKASSSLLKPGQQAVVDGSNTGNTIQVSNGVDLDAVMAWKNGFFQFSGADLSLVLRQLSRWYDIEIVYSGKMPDREFEGKIGRDLNLSQVLKLLEKVQVHFRIEGKRLIVLP